MQSIIFRVLILTVVLAGWARGDVLLPKVIGPKMLLQRGVPVSIWGRADAGEGVTVRFAGQERRTVAGADGRWSVTLDPMPAEGAGREMTIEGKNTVRLADVVVGDVWVCSGQSNMEYPVRRPEKFRGPKEGTPDRSAEALAAGRHAGLRLLKVQKVLSPDDITTDGWQDAEGEALAKFSAAGFFFGKEVYGKTGVPIGLIDSSWGGTRIEVWTSEDGYVGYPEVDAPTTRPLFVDGSPVGRQYGRMIRPLTPYRVKGFLWYQGESNVVAGDGERYAAKQRALIEGWRSAFRAEDAPFYFVQLAPYAYANRKQTPPIPPDMLGYFREAQAKALALPRTGMVVTTDLVDNLGDIHPWNKWEVGRRLALLALSRDYGMKEVVAEGPAMSGATFGGGRAVIEFARTGEGLKTADGKAPTGFTLAGPDGVFHPADAVIEGGGRVIVSSTKVPEPKAVRFAWNEREQPNLTNGAGLPAEPFRTDGGK